MYQCSVEGAKVDRLHCTLMSIGDTVSAVLPRDAILTRYMLSSCVRVLSKRTHGSISFFGMGATFDLISNF